MLIKKDSFATLHYAQNDNKLGFMESWWGYFGGKAAKISPPTSNCLKHWSF